MPDATRVDVPATAAGYGGGGDPTGTWREPPQPPPPDRRPWILVGVLGLIVIVLILILVLRKDDNSSTDTAATTTTTALVSTTSSSSSSTSTTSSTSSSTTSTTAPLVTIPPATCAQQGKGPAKPGLAADTVYDAWVRGDEACAKTLMTTAAANELFSRDGTDADHEAQGCTDVELPDPHTDCAFTYDGGSTHYLMQFSDTEGWKVYDITQVAD